MTEPTGVNTFGAHGFGDADANRAFKNLLHGCNAISQNPAVVHDVAARPILGQMAGASPHSVSAVRSPFSTTNSSNSPPTIGTMPAGMPVPNLNQFAQAPLFPNLILPQHSTSQPQPPLLDSSIVTSTNELGWDPLAAVNTTIVPDLSFLDPSCLSQFWSTMPSTQQIVLPEIGGSNSLNLANVSESLAQFSPPNLYLPDNNLSPLHIPFDLNVPPPLFSNVEQQHDLSQMFSAKQVSQHGLEMYARAFEDWNVNQSTYDPFKTTEVLQYASQPEAGNTQSNPKPSYSDVARSQRNASSHGPVKAEKEYISDENVKRLADIQTRMIRQSRRMYARPHVQRGKGGDGGAETSTSCVIDPDSKYGLDQFDDDDDVSVIDNHKHDDRKPSAGMGKCDNTWPVSPPYVRKDSYTNARSPEDKLTDDQYSPNRSNIPSSHYNKKSNIYNPNRDHNKGASVPPHLSSKRIESKRDASPVYLSQSEDVFRTKDTNISQHVGRKSSYNDLGYGILLNNGKPASLSGKFGTSAVHRSHNSDYINNDLHDINKRSNQTNHAGKDESHTHMHTCSGKNPRVSESGKGFSKPTTKVKATFHTGKHGKVKHTFPGPKTGDPSSSTENNPKNTAHANLDQELIDEWVRFCQEKAKWLLKQTWSLLVTTFILLLSILALLVSGLAHLLIKTKTRLCAFLHSKLSHGGKSWCPGSWGVRPERDTKYKHGLEENITLPSTGDEALQRLLACKGKDPYRALNTYRDMRHVAVITEYISRSLISDVDHVEYICILGLSADSSDDEIKKYYRKQAVLVHPDKNQQPGAEEAFKILGHAFELIGEPEKRKLYDSNKLESNHEDAAMQQFADLLSKLQEKIQEAANLMRCDNCGGKHRRIPVDRPWYSARFCDRCNARHSVKGGDVWAETSMLGFLWHYYAFMDGRVYDITEWVSCQRNFFKHMKGNAHQVFYRIATDGKRGQQQGKSGNDSHLEDFINHLFHKATYGGDEGAMDSRTGQQGKSSTSGSGSASTGGNHPGTAAGNMRRNKRAKATKKH